MTFCSLLLFLLVLLLSCLCLFTALALTHGLTAGSSVDLFSPQRQLDGPAGQPSSRDGADFKRFFRCHRDESGLLRDLFHILFRHFSARRLYFARRDGRLWPLEEAHARYLVDHR